MAVQHRLHAQGAALRATRTGPSRRLWRILLIVLLLNLALYGGLVRPWIMRWGATDQELVQSLPGDNLIPLDAVVSTRALTIDAPADKVWPWLVQLGQGRGGFYSYTWLENLFAADMVNADRVNPSLQGIVPGDLLSFGEGWYTTRVSVAEPNRVLILGDWTFYLESLDAATTRFIIRYPFKVGDGIGEKLFYYGIFEPAHFVMESGLMMGIKVRAEQEAGR